MQQYDIFISYKRKGASSATAAYLYELLLRKGYNVFFDRKEMRSGKFDEQLLEHISKAEDIFILLEEESLQSWFSEKDEIERRVREDEDVDTIQEPIYKSDWFCRELIHALSLEGKNIVPLLLNGYEMPAENDLPQEMKGLSKLQALPLDISRIEELYQEYFVNKEYLKSKPQNLALARQSISKGPVIASFLFHTDAESCEMYERGEKIITLTDDYDRKNPFFYPVPFAGEHHFDFFNNDTCEEIEIVKEVLPNCQAYIPVVWQPMQRIWELTEEKITAEKDIDRLLFWGRWLFEGTSKNEPDLSRAVLCFRKTAKLNTQKTLEFIRDSLDETMLDYFTTEERFLWYEMLATKGDAAAQYHLGIMFHHGIGVNRNKKKSIEWFTKAAEQGYDKAQYRLGFIHSHSNGDEQDYPKAIEWFTKAAEQGYVRAQYQLGFMSERGKGFVKDSAKAIDWYTKAAEQGYSKAQYRLGYMYAHSKGIRKDYIIAIEWFSKAAEQGDENSYHQLAWVYHFMGKYEEALPWAEKTVECSPDIYVGYDMLASVYQKLGRDEDALEQYKKCLELANVDDEATDEEISKIKENIKTLKKLLRKRR